MDWIRLGSSGCDLTGTRGVITPVSHAELAQHCKASDAWLAIRGKCYNVTRYMDFHPGGKFIFYIIFIFICVLFFSLHLYMVRGSVLYSGLQIT